MQFSVSHGIMYPRSKHWYAFVGTLLLILFASLLVGNNFIGIVLLVVFVSCYVFYAFVLVPKATKLLVTEGHLQWNTTLYRWDSLQSFWVEIDNINAVKHIYFQKSWNGELLTMNFFDDSDKLALCIKEIIVYLPFEQPYFSALERVMRFLKL